MTNADKFLKDDTDGGEFVKELVKKISYFDSCRYYSEEMEHEIVMFLEEQVIPKLTEDERVILRNIDKQEYFYIGRADDVTDNLYLVNDRHGRVDIDMFNELFRFIKERRRI